MKQLEQQLFEEQKQRHVLMESSQSQEKTIADYRETVSQLEEEIKAKDRILAEVRMSVEQKEKKLEMKTEEYEANQAQTVRDMVAATETIRTLEVDIGNRDMMLQNMQSDMEYKDHKLSELTASSSQSHQLVCDMEFKLAGQDDELTRLKHELETVRRDFQEVQAEVENFRSAGVTVDIYHELLQQNRTLESSMTELQREMAELRVSLDLSQTECQQLRFTLNSTSSSDTEQKAAVLSLEARLLEMETHSQDEITRWKEEVSSMSDQLSSCMAELEQLKERQRVGIEENMSLHTALSGKDEKLRTIALQLEASESNVHQIRMELEAATSTHQMTIGKLHRQIEQSELQVKELEGLIEGKDVLVVDTKAELEVVRKQFDDLAKQDAEHQQMLVDRETLLSNTIATLHQQLQESAASIETLSAKCKEQEMQVHSLMSKLDNRDTKIASLSENFKEEELQLIAVTKELEACKTQAAKDRISVETEWKKVVDLKDAEIATMREGAQNQETSVKKYVAVIKKLKQQLQEEKLKREDLEKLSSSSLDDSAASAREQIPASEEKLAVFDEPDRPAEPVVPTQLSVTSATVASSHETPNIVGNVKDSAEQQISELKQINNQLKLEISKLETKSDEYETSVSRLNEVIAGLETENVALKGDVENMSAELRKASDFSHAQMQDMLMELNSWKSTAVDVEQMRNSIAVLESEKLSASSQVEAMSSEMTKLRNDLVARSENIDWLSTQLSDEIAQKESLNHERDGYRDMHAKLQSEYVNVSNERTLLEQQLAVNSDTLKQTSDDNAQLRSTCDALEVEVQALKAELAASKVTETEGFREYDEKKSAREDVQTQVEKLQQIGANNAWKSVEEYSVLENENIRLAEQCSSLTTCVEEYRNKCKALVRNAAEQEEHSAEKTQDLLGKVKATEARNTFLEQHLREVESEYAKNLSSFEQIQKELEAEKTRLEFEVERLTEMVLKSEGTVQQLVAELGAEREEFSLRESELEGSSEELQLEVARLAQKVETDVVEVERWKCRSSEIEGRLQSLAAEKDSVERERNECLESNRKLAEDIEFWRQEHEKLCQEKEQLAGEFLSNQDVAERKYATLSGQYDMLSTDINNYQELVESLRSKNSQLEQQLQQTSAQDAGQKAVNREQEIEREKMEDERQTQIKELEYLRERELKLLDEIKRLNLQIEDYCSTEEELLDTRSTMFALQTENDLLRRSNRELEQRVHELAAVEREQSALQEQYLAVLQDNSALIRQSKDMYEKLRSVNELAEKSGSEDAAEVAALAAEVEMLRSERENVMQKDRECDRLRAELAELKATSQQMTAELQSRQHGFEAVHGDIPAVARHKHSLNAEPTISEAARVHVVPVHSSPHRVTSDDMQHEISHLKTQVTSLLKQCE